MRYLYGCGACGLVVLSLYAQAVWRNVEHRFNEAEAHLTDWRKQELARSGPDVMVVSKSDAR